MSEFESKPLVFRDGDPAGNQEVWVAWIDYCAQGSSEHEALQNFANGWAATIELNVDRGITPQQMMEARYPDTAGEIAQLKSEIERLNAWIIDLHSERATFAAQMNAELDRLRDRLAERDGAE